MSTTRFELMTRSLVLLCALLAFVSHACAEGWRPVADLDRAQADGELTYVKRTADRPSDGKEVTANLVFFTSRTSRLEVIDLGDGSKPSHRSLAQAFRANGCVAGVKSFGLFVIFVVPLPDRG